MGLYQHQIDELRKYQERKWQFEEEIRKLEETRRELFGIENMIRRYGDRVDIKGYTLLSQIERVIAWAGTGEFSIEPTAIKGRAESITDT